MHMHEFISCLGSLYNPRAQFTLTNSAVPYAPRVRTHNGGLFGGRITRDVCDVCYVLGGWGRMTLCLPGLNQFKWCIILVSIEVRGRILFNACTSHRLCVCVCACLCITDQMENVATNIHTPRLFQHFCEYGPRLCGTRSVESANLFDPRGVDKYASMQESHF